MRPRFVIARRGAPPVQVRSCLPAAHPSGVARTVPVVLLSLLLVVAGSARGQGFGPPGPFAAGSVVIELPNPQAGTAVLRIHLHYPALLAGVGAPADGEHGPYPLVVFGHGIGNSPEPYADLLDHFASWGFVVAAPDTATWGPEGLLAQDMLGTVAALQQLAHAAGGGPATFIAPGLVGMSGHSLGGGAAIIAGALLPACGAVLAIAPWNQAETLPGGPSTVDVAAMLHAPLAIIVGSEDAIAPLLTNSLPLYDAATSVPRLRLLSVVAGAGHNDPLLISQVGNDGTALLRAYLHDDAAALDEVYGPSAQSDPLATLTFEVVDPDCFLTGSAAAGQVLGIHASAAPGSMLLCAMAAGTVAGSPQLPGLLLPPDKLLVLTSGLTGPSQLLSLQVKLPASLSGIPQLTWYLQSVRLLPGGGVDCSPLRTFTLQP